MFQLNEEPLTGQSGPVNLAGKMAPKERKTPERVEGKTKRKSPKDKQKATVIRDEPERNLFLECLQSINQPLRRQTPQKEESQHDTHDQPPHHQHRQ